MELARTKRAYRQVGGLRAYPPPPARRQPAARSTSNAVAATTTAAWMGAALSGSRPHFN